MGERLVEKTDCLVEYFVSANVEIVVGSEISTEEPNIEL